MNFIQSLAPHAQKIWNKYHILASLVMAQACLESNFGKSGLAQKGKNLFGIKGKYEGQCITMRTAEYKKGEKYYINATFRKYPSYYESLEDLALLYCNGVSWDRSKYHKIIGETDYKKACRAVQSAGYATDPIYANKLISLIEKYKLYQYDSVPKKECKQRTKQKTIVYTVKKGDTLSNIALKYHSSVKKIADKNKIKDTNRILVGQKLEIDL